MLIRTVPPRYVDLRCPWIIYGYDFFKYLSLKLLAAATNSTLSGLSVYAQPCIVFSPINCARRCSTRFLLAFVFIIRNRLILTISDIIEIVALEFRFLNLPRRLYSENR